MFELQIVHTRLRPKVILFFLAVQKAYVVRVSSTRHSYISTIYFTVDYGYKSSLTHVST
jgi:hypothetical protein